MNELKYRIHTLMIDYGCKAIAFMVVGLIMLVSSIPLFLVGVIIYMTVRSFI